MLGMGRFGSILGSAVGGALLGLGWGFGAIFAALAVPAFCAAAAIVLTQAGGATNAAAAQSRPGLRPGPAGALAPDPRC
jgi:AAHS family 4-hydroxybenzoate transporter-like MFS transporter